MNAALLTLLRRLVRNGNLTVTFSSGEQVILGDGTGKPASIRIVDAEAEKAIVRDPGLRFGEMYMDGRVENVVVPVTDSRVERTIRTTGPVRQVQVNRDYGAIAEFERM